MRRMPLRSLAAVLVLALASGGCSFRLGSVFGQGGEDRKAEHTSSITPVAVSAQATRAQADDALRAATNELLSRNEPNASLPWQNPRTGARGTVTPINGAYTQAGITCRDFLASYVDRGAEDWLHGEACRVPQGYWEIRRLKPWTRS
jgi:surface antigen